ncbi:MAG: transposon-encoded TnpW family protein [Clostridiales bacterium]|nr:transposon-encoded TnpW family protein [Clostridiales bacterium]MCD8126323.1 transposon-encoded TnpW family protein [Clostridiales bacterium]
MKIGGTTYNIGLHFSKTSKESLDDKVKRLTRQDVKTENF